MVECQLPKLDVAGSTPVSRSRFEPRLPLQPFQRLRPNPVSLCAPRAPFVLRLVHQQAFFEVVHHVEPAFDWRLRI